MIEPTAGWAREPKVLMRGSARVRCAQLSQPMTSVTVSPLWESLSMTNVQSSPASIREPLSIEGSTQEAPISHNQVPAERKYPFEAVEMRLYACWLAERAERVSEGFSARAGILLSAVGVELGFIPRTNVRGTPWWLLVLAQLIVSAGLLLGALWPRRTRIPAVADLRAHFGDQREFHTTAVDQLIGYFDEPTGYIRQLDNDAKYRGRFFLAGVLMFLGAQVALVTALWVR